MINFDDDQLFQIILSSFIFFRIFYDECNQILCLSLWDNANFLTGTNKFWISFFISSPKQNKGKISKRREKVWNSQLFAYPVRYYIPAARLVLDQIKFIWPDNSRIATKNKSLEKWKFQNIPAKLSLDLNKSEKTRNVVREMKKRMKHCISKAQNFHVLVKPDWNSVILFVLL